MAGISLAACRPVRWLIATESDVHRRLLAFIAGGEGEDVLDVAGPPSAQEMMECSRKRSHKPHLPLVRLRLRRVRHHLTGEIGIEATCSDEAVREIVSWAREAALRTKLAAQIRN